jgi:D-sedoheptulose 7-phosphate isomerase
MKLNAKKNNFHRNYFNNLSNLYKNINLSELNKITQILLKIIKNNKNIYVAGNGGSAAIANHLLCDFNKGIKISSKKVLKPKIISLCNSIEIMTAISNDIGYDRVFSFQLENYAKKGDCLICISSSGQSKNIIKAINFAKKSGIKIILFQGFGKLNKKIKPDYYINLNYKNYGITEDVFQSLMHSISQNIRYNYVKNREIL